MSVIAAKVCKSSIEVSCDSILTKGTCKKTNFSKVNIYDDLLVGGCGDAEELSLFFEFAENYTPKGATIKEIQDFLIKFSHSKEEVTGECTINNSYIICYKNKLFETDGLFVQQIRDYVAIGEGEPYALAALALGHTAHEAVKVACDLCCFVSEPIFSYVINEYGPSLCSKD